MRRRFVLILAAMAAVAGIMVAPASAAKAPIGRVGDILRGDPVHPIQLSALCAERGANVAQWNL